MIKTISYLGLGTMGSGMASNLLKAGCKLTILLFIGRRESNGTAT
jgi:3-hydroxyisobutyrate dehydrogenase-like beta-hydroxyacid dehydrogenase